MRRRQDDMGRARREQLDQDGFGGGDPFDGVGPAEQFVEQEQVRLRTPAGA